MPKRNPGGYTNCACPDCFEIAIGEPDEAVCSECEDAGCDLEGECQAENAYGGDMEENPADYKDILLILKRELLLWPMSKIIRHLEDVKAPATVHFSLGANGKLAFSAKRPANSLVTTSVTLERGLSDARVENAADYLRHTLAKNLLHDARRKKMRKNGMEENPRRGPQRSTKVHPGAIAGLKPEWNPKTKSWEIGEDRTAFARRVTLVNPSPDNDGKRFILWFGEYSPTYLMAWADDLEDAVELAVDWIVENEPGHLMDDEVEEAYNRAIAEGKSEEAAMEEAEADMTCFGHDGMHYLAGWQWGVSLENPNRRQLIDFVEGH